MRSQKPYRRAVLGGTFDRLHAAHESLLFTAAFIADEVFVGVVSEELGRQLFQNKGHADMIQPYNIRAASVANFLKRHIENAEVGALTDPWGPAPSDPKADVIVVSSETEKSAFTINEMRNEIRLDELDIVVIPGVRDKDGTLLSSTLMRKREIQTD